MRCVPLIALALMLTIASFACAGEQAGNAQGEEEDAEKVVTGSEMTAQAPSNDTASGQVSTSASATGNADHYRLDCRMQTHIFKEYMSKAEAKDFTARITYRVQANLNGGGDKNLGDILDELNIPAYDTLCG